MLIKSYKRILLQASMWVIFTTFWSLIQLWIVVLTSSLRKNYTVNLADVMQEGVLLFFSTTLVITIAIDYRLLEESKSTSKFLNDVIYYFPFFILFFCVTIYLTMYNVEAESLELTLIGAVQLVLIFSSLLYSFLVKSVQFLNRKA